MQLQKIKIMKSLLTVILALFSFGIFAQDSTSITELSYCKETFKIPDSCSAKSKYELTCADFTIQWLYMNEKMLAFMPQQIVKQLESKLKKVKKTAIKCISLETEIDGYLITYKDGKKKKYKIIAYGIVQGQPVLINLGLTNNPTENNKLHEFVRQIIEIKKE